MERKPLVLILCGGRSLRLWPLSNYKSKNFLDFFAHQPLKATIDRFRKITPLKNIFLVANRNEKSLLYRLKEIDKRNIFLEPQSKNTAAAILFSLLRLTNHRERILIISPVDSFIKKEKIFYRDLAKALRVARRGYICTLGIIPDKFSTGLGYIKKAGSGKNGIFDVEEFVEKPSLKKGRKLFKAGRILYNSGIFVSYPAVIEEEYQKYYVSYHFFKKSLAKNKVDLAYRKIEGLSFDRAVVEKSRKIKVVQANFQWKDFGNWQTIFEIMAKDAQGNVSPSNASLKKCKDSFIYSTNPGKKILALGLKDIFYIDTPDYVLLSSRDRLEKLKSFLEKA
ncbi:MAG: hypothetical protein GF375_07950 [Candidatus Omnitrophica bacterium]|nr:hypothetical protein [Candidatus Omnitrophota bacterium]MBD3269891.1 hypothetical protein [Candidatus Omnitrophota bacterium]